MTAKCEAALAEAASAPAANFAPVASEPPDPPPGVPAKSEPPARKPVSPTSVPEKKRPAPPVFPAAEPVPAPPPPPSDDFAAQYADFDESSVADAFSRDRVPEESSDVAAGFAVPASSSAKKNDAAALKAAVESVPAAIREFVAEHFQARFDRLVPASQKVKIYSAHGELAAPGEERSESAEDDSASDTADSDELSPEN